MITGFLPSDTADVYMEYVYFTCALRFYVKFYVLKFSKFYKTYHIIEKMYILFVSVRACVERFQVCFKL